MSFLNGAELRDPQVVEEYCGQIERTAVDLTGLVREIEEISADGHEGKVCIINRMDGVKVVGVPTHQDCSDGTTVGKEVLWNYTRNLMTGGLEFTYGGRRWQSQ